MIDRWMRVVLPWWWQGLMAVGAIRAICATLLLCAAGWDWGVFDGDLVRRNSLVIFGLFPGIYAVYRVVAFHPLTRVGYARWLRSTPWTRRQPLPLGPIHLVGQDVVIVGAMALLAGIGDRGWEIALFVGQVFTACYLLALGVCLAGTGERGFAYATGFGLGLAVRLWQGAPLSLAAAGATYAVAWVGLRRSMARFPWESESERGTYFPGKQPALIPPDGLGWPFARLGPRVAATLTTHDATFLEALRGPRAPAALPTRDAVLLGALGGWWVHCAGWLTPVPGERTDWFQMVPGVVLCLFPLGRLLWYCASYRPPISLWGRIRTGHWVIPGYDRVLVAPLLAWAAGTLLALVLHSVHVGVEVWAPVVIAFVLATVLGVGPGRREWQLTGQHRMVFMPEGAFVKQGGASVG